VKLGCPDWVDLYKDCCCSKLCSFSFVTAPLCILGFGLIWIVSPVLHFIQAVIAMFGVQPVGGKDFAIKGKGLERFWLVVMILKSCEQLFEALPQTLINVIYLDRQWHNLSDWEIAKLVTSSVFSCGSLLIFIAHNVYKSLFNYENSIVGLYKSELEFIEPAHSSVSTSATRTDVRNLPARSDDYEIQKFLGSGHFGNVYLAEKGGKNFAIKKVVNTEQDTAEQEIKILEQVDHNRIIKYYDHYMETSILCIVLEYADVGTMENYVKKFTKPKEEWNVWRVVSHLSSALEYLHGRRPQILHHDLKPDNILGVTVWDTIEKKGLNFLEDCGFWCG